MSFQVLGIDIPVANGYSSYQAFLNDVFSTKKVTYGGPDLRGGSEVYTLGLVATSPSLESFHNFLVAVDKLNQIGYQAGGAFSPIVSDVQKILTQLSKKGITNFSGVLSPDPSPLISLTVQPDPSKTEDSLKISTFQYQTSVTASTDGQIPSTILPAITQKSYTIREDIVLTPSRSVSSRELYMEGEGTRLSLLYGTSYVICLDMTSNPHSITFKLLEKNSSSEDKIDALAAVGYPPPTEDIIIQNFAPKLEKMRELGFTPLAILTTKCKPSQAVALTSSFGIPTIPTYNSLIELPKYRLARVQPQDRGPDWQALTQEMYRKSWDLVFADEQLDNTVTKDWLKVAPSSVIGLSEAYSFLRQLKNQTKSLTLDGNSGLVKQLTDFIENILKYLNLISEFTRQLNLMVQLITQLFKAIEALASLNLYMLASVPPMVPIDSSADLKNLYLNATGLPKQEDLYYASVIMVFSYPTTSSISSQLATSYGLGENEALPEYLSNRAQAAFKDSPQGQDAVRTLIDLLRQAKIL